MPTKRELIGSQLSIEQIRRRLGADTLGYLSLEGMLAVTSIPDDDFCVACFSGKYPTPIENNRDKLKLG
jgi:amidophosphoribosyltransferase